MRTRKKDSAPQLGNRWNEGQQLCKVRWRGRDPHAQTTLPFSQCPLSSPHDGSIRQEANIYKKKNQKPMRARLPRDSGETKGGLQRRRLAGWRDEIFLFRVPCPLRGCTAASSVRPRPPTTNHHHNITACPPVSPPRNQTRPGVGRSKVSDSPRPRERGGRPPSIHPPPAAASPTQTSRPMPKQGTRKPPHHDKAKAKASPKAGRRRECACVLRCCSKHVQPSSCRWPGASCRLQPTTPLLQSVHQVRKEKK